MLRPLAAVCLLALFAGCGTGLPETAHVRGTVTFDKRPLASGKIIFYPEHGRPAIGTIQADGSYVLTTFSPGDGATLGRHRVAIEAFKVETREIQLKDGTFTIEPIGNPIWLVPQNYSDPATSPLEREVLPGKNEINFDLP